MNRWIISRAAQDKMAGRTRQNGGPLAPNTKTMGSNPILCTALRLHFSVLLAYRDLAVDQGDRNLCCKAADEAERSRLLKHIPLQHLASGIDMWIS